MGGEQGPNQTSNSTPSASERTATIILFELLAGACLAVAVDAMSKGEFDARTWFLNAGAAVFFFAGVLWHKLLHHFSPRSVGFVGRLALDVRFWLLLGVFVLGWATVPSKINDIKRYFADPANVGGTRAKIQFNGENEAPEVLQHNNLNVVVTTYTTQTIKDGECHPPPLGNTILSGALASPECTPARGVSITNTIIVLTLDNVFKYTDIKLNSHGARVPALKVLSRGERSAVLLFSGSLAHFVLDLDLVQP